MGDGADRAAAINARISAAALAFNQEVESFVSGITKEQLPLLHKKIALEALKRLVLKTPVATGRARGGWLVTLDAPPIGSSAKEEKTTTKLDKTGGGVIAQGSAIVDSIKPFGIVHIYNNVSYVIWLEDGHSKQAPSGMVVVTIQELRQMFP